MNRNPDNIHLPEMPLPPGLPPDDDFPCCRQHPAEALLTASEVKVLTETATKVAYALGRMDALEEVVATLDDQARELKEQARSGGSEEINSHLRTRGGAFNDAAFKFAQDLSSLPSQATSDATSGVPESSEVGLESQAGSNRLPQEPCGHPTCPCAEGSTS